VLLLLVVSSESNKGNNIIVDFLALFDKHKNLGLSYLQMWMIFQIKVCCLRALNSLINLPKKLFYNRF